LKKLLEWGVTGSQKLDQDIPKRDALKAMKKAEKIGYNEEKKRQARSEKKIKMMEKQEEKAKKAKEKAEEKAKESNNNNNENNSSATSSRTAEDEGEVSSGEEDPDETKKALWDSAETKNDPNWEWKIDAPEENKSEKKKKKKRLSSKEEDKESTDSSDGSIAKNKKEHR